MAEITQQQYQELISKGLTPEKIAILAKQRGLSLPTSGDTGLAGIATGVAKGGIEIARGTAQLLQGTGQRVMAGLSPLSLEQVRQQTGFKSLDETTQEGRGVSEMLKSKSTEEVIGKVAANVASFFVPTSKATQVAGRITKGAGPVSYTHLTLPTKRIV